MKVGDKEWKRRLEDICSKCGHRRGAHNDAKMCSDCYDKKINYKEHSFNLNKESSK